MRIKIGTTFHATYADGMCLWKVTARRGKDCWVAEVIDDEYHGSAKVFGVEEIEANIQQDNYVDQSRVAHNDFYRSLQIGQVVHYRNGSVQYVRCQVVLKDGKKVLKPIGLIGEWNSWDLPIRNANGTIHRGFFGEMISKGDTFTPNYSNIVESRHEIPMGPREISAAELIEMPLIDLSISPMSEEQKDIAYAMGKKQEIQALLDKVTDTKSLKEFFTALYESN